ncbi:MAG: SiaB family protein kinase [Microscillaceae bacterium]|nr:SiaB family protein kinase [Microscillaceae bacterium]MDW8460034.1 SiaB family protein kinase [Cytophagales bacterium]
MNFFEKLTQQLEFDTLLLAHKGELTQDIMLGILKVIEIKMEVMGESLATRKKVFNITVECLQNIVKYTRLPPGSTCELEPVFALTKKGDIFLIASGNSVERSAINKIIEKLNHVNSLDKAGLVQLYKQISQENLKMGMEAHKNSAGLGFVDMARKAGNPLKAEFVDTKYPDYVFFFFYVTVKTVHKDKGLE